MLQVLTLPFVALHLATVIPTTALSVSVYQTQGSGPLTIQALQPTQTIQQAQPAAVTLQATSLPILQPSAIRLQ